MNAMKNENLKSEKLISKPSASISNNTFFLLIILVLVIDIFIYHRNIFILNTQTWQTQMLTMDYSYGFIRRGLLGTFSTLIKNCFNIRFVTAYTIVQLTGILFFFISTLLFFQSILKNKDDRSFCFVALIYLSFNHFGFVLSAYGLLETYNMAFTILMVYLIIKDKALFLIPILAGICVMIHEAYPMMLFGVIVAALIYRFCYAENKALKCKYAIVFVTTGLVVSILFYLSYFKFAYIATPDVEAVLATCRERLGVNFEPSNLRTAWLDPKENLDPSQSNLPMWLNGQPTRTFTAMMRIVILNIAFCSPLIFMRAKFWIRLIKREKVLYRKFLLILCSLSVLLILPMIIMHCDQGRWFYSVLFSEVILTGSVILLNYNNERKTLYEITELSIPKIILVVFYTLFYSLNPEYALLIISKNLVNISNWLFR